MQEKDVINDIISKIVQKKPAFAGLFFIFFHICVFFFIFSFLNSFISSVRIKQNRIADAIRSISRWREKSTGKRGMQQSRQTR